jgi:hypothetical protein
MDQILGRKKVGKGACVFWIVGLSLAGGRDKYAHFHVIG